MKYKFPYYLFDFSQKVNRWLGLISKDRYLSRRSKYRYRYRKYKSDDSSVKQYLNYILDENFQKRPNTFQAMMESDFVREPGDPKVIAWYLPQYHQIDVNNKFHGRGFTEWTNVTRAMPAFAGHYQPHLPYDVGFYDLMNPDTFRRQIELANKYGVYAFAFHWYWFSGKRTMEKPLEMFLKHPEFDIHFCINWANENWSRLWDGGNKELIFEQKLLDEDDEKLFKDLLPYFRDDRYIKINGKPLFSIYRPEIFGKNRFVTLTDNLRKFAINSGFKGVYIVITNAFDFKEDPKEWGADALAEFPPFGVRAERKPIDGYKNPHFKANVFDFEAFLKKRGYLYPHNADNYYRSALVAFDNTARKGFSNNGSVFYGASPEYFRQNVEEIAIESKNIHSTENNFIFVNSWNEWAEGSHLEPDQKYGYAFLNALRRGIEDARKAISDTFILEKASKISEPTFVVNCVESLGDVIACEPISRYLKENFKKCKIIWVVRKIYAEAISFNPNIDELIYVDSLFDADKVCLNLLNDKKTILVDTHFNGRISSKKGSIHVNPVNPAIHDSNYFSFNGILSAFSLIAGLPALKMPPVFWLEPNIEALLSKKISSEKKYIVVHTKPSEETKEWPLKKWKNVIEKLIDLDYTIIEVGQENTLKLSNSSFISASDMRCSLQENAAIIKNAKLFIGIDSCFAHVANCFDVPSVILLGAYKAFAKHTPFSNERSNRVELYMHKISDITEEEVLDNVRKLLSL